MDTKFPIHLTHDISGLYLAVCRSYDLIRERVWTITFFSQSFASSEVVIPCVYFMNAVLDMGP